MGEGTQEAGPREEGARMNRADALKIVATLSPEQLEAVAMVVETADAQGDYHFDGEGSVWEDDVNATLRYLATEIRQFLPPIREVAQVYVGQPVLYKGEQRTAPDDADRMWAIWDRPLDHSLPTVLDAPDGTTWFKSEASAKRALLSYPPCEHGESAPQPGG